MAGYPVLLEDLYPINREQAEEIIRLSDEAETEADRTGIWYSIAESKSNLEARRKQRRANWGQMS